MPRPAKNEAQKQLEQQVADLIKNFKADSESGATPAQKINIPRAISLFEKAQKNINQALAVLKGEGVGEEESNSSKKRAGRPRKGTSLAGADDSSDTQDAAESPETEPAVPRSRRRKEAASEA